MNYFSIIILSLILVSCGKETVTKKYNLPYVDPEVQTEINKLKDDLSFLNDLLLTQGASLIALEDMITETQIKLTELSTQERVINLVDPCGDDLSNFDEILFRMSSGKFVAYFEKGSNRFLTVLEEDVHYRTTDDNKCDFKIVNGELVEL